MLICSINDVSPSYLVVKLHNWLSVNVFVLETQNSS